MKEEAGLPRSKVPQSIRGHSADAATASARRPATLAGSTDPNPMGELALPRCGLPPLTHNPVPITRKTSDKS